VVAAIAGLTVPAVIFLLFNASGENARAWGVVISTDTAFLIGALAIIKPKYPARLRIFLLTLSVVDDIGALCVIALVYSGRIQVVPLVVSVALIVAIASVRFMPAARGPAYAVLGVALWVALSLAGINPTLAGVAVALLIPVFTPERQQVEQAVGMIRAFRQSPNSQYARAATRGLRESISINESDRFPRRVGGLPGNRLGQPAGTGGAEADPASRPRPRPHPRRSQRNADAGGVRRLRVPVLQPRHRRHR
jgi:hypothetical protein